MVSRILPLTLALLFSSISYSEDEVNEYTAIPDAELQTLLPEWAFAEMQLESAISDISPIVLGDEHQLSTIGKLTGQPLWSQDGEYWNFVIEYGGENTIECFLFTDDSEPMSSLLSVNSHVFSWYLPENGEVTQELLTNSGLHLVGSNAVYALDYLYRMTDANNNPAILYSQGRVVSNGNNNLSCINVTFGYRKTFDRIFNQLAASWEYSPKSDIQPYSTEKFVIYFQDAAVGTAEITMEKDADNDTLIRNTQSMMIKTSPTTLLIQETTQIEYSTPDGKLINSFAQESRDGNIQTSFGISSDGDGNWIVSGASHGKDQEYTITPEEAPDSTLGRYVQAREFIADAELESTKASVWIPSLDPTNFVSAVITAEKREKDNNQLRFEMGPISMSAIMSDAGYAKSITSKLGPVDMRFESIVSEGSF